MTFEHGDKLVGNMEDLVNRLYEEIGGGNERDRDGNRIGIVYELQNVSMTRIANIVSILQEIYEAQQKYGEPKVTA